MLQGVEALPLEMKSRYERLRFLLVFITAHFGPLQCVKKLCPTRTRDMKMKRRNIKKKAALLCFLIGLVVSAQGQISPSNECCFYTYAGMDASRLQYCVKFERGKVWLKDVYYDKVRDNLTKSASFYDNEIWEDKGTEEKHEWGVDIMTGKCERMFVYCPNLSTASRIVYKRHVEFTFTHGSHGIMLFRQGYGCVRVQDLPYGARRFYYNFDMYVAFSPDKSSFIFWYEESNNIDGKVDKKETYTRVPKSELLPKSVNYDFLSE